MRTAGDQTTRSDGRRAAAEEALERELTRIVASGEYADWFRRMSQFHRYSAGNAMWIAAQQAQRPDVSGPVASYRTWQQVGRQVRRGEQGMMVFHPKPCWVDPATGERVRPPRSDGDRPRLVRRVQFGVGYVFAQSQTDGEPLELGRPAPQDAPAALARHLDRYCRDQQVTVQERLLPSGLAGYYQRDGDLVVLSTAVSAGERAATLAHELAHREDPELIAADAAGDRRYYAHNRPDCEAVAEAAAHVLSARFGHDVTGHSAGYIAGWIRGDVDRFRQLQERVGRVSRRLVPPDRIDQLLTAARQDPKVARRGRGR